MLYLWVKLIHVVSSTILFGTGIGTASVMIYGYLNKKIEVAAAIHKYVVLADWIFTLSSGSIQLLTGLLLVYLAGYSFFNFWILASLAGYLIALSCWLPVVYLQIQMKKIAIQCEENHLPLPQIYYRHFRIWFLLGWPAFLSLLVVFYLMVNKPIL